ncbi:carbohydrate porin [Eudoraea adriatica]|uniref:carbohydrate porin n=1 Tax=Eudoraea adriatica TaxID=446681 RepID=UPI0003A138F0|nr:carbohydrate porin [Eudoraea adriatica]
MKQKRSAIARKLLFCTAFLWGLLYPTLIFGQLGSVQSGATKSSAIQVDTSGTAGSEGFFNQEYLTGNWWGARSFLEDRGVSFDLRYSATYQGLIEGTGDKSFDYGGKVNALINFETDKMGLWKGGGFNFHLEYRHGQAQANLGGTVFAVNTALFLPSDSPEELIATTVTYTQKIGNGHLIKLGKFNPIDIYATDPFYGGWGVDRFMNIVLVAPPSGLIPVVFMGGLASINLEPVTLTAVVFDPNDRTNDYFPGDLFKDGVTFGVNATRVAKLAGRHTSYGITGFYSTAEGTDYSTLGNGIINTSTETGAFNINVQFKHNLQESTRYPSAAWGISFKTGIADGNPNYVRASLVAGIGGNPLFFGRHQDSFGIGYFYYNLSDVLEDSFNPLVSIEDESGMEIFYSYSITPWLYIGVDMQYINPFRERFKNAFIGGLRTQIRI